MRYIALDPGGTTGVCVYLEQPNVWKRTQLSGAHHETLWKLLHRFKPTELIVERFVYRKGLDNVDLRAREYIGVAELYAQTEEIELVYQTPAQAKGAFSDKVLKRLKLHMPGRPHANDATRHMLHYLVVTQGRKDLLRPLRPGS